MEELLLKTKRVINYIINIIQTFILIISVVIIFQAILGFDNFNWLFVSLPLIPILGFFLFTIISQKYNWNSIIKIIIKVIGCILSGIFLLCIEFGILFTMPFTSYEPSIKQYKNTISTLKRLYKTVDLSYFPEEIPEGASDYYCLIGGAFDGYNIYYVKFNTDEMYLKNLTEKYKTDILLTGTKDTLYTKGLDITINELNDSFNIYLLKRQNSNCNKCKYGFAINTNDKTVYFFFQNY